MVDIQTKPLLPFLACGLLSGIVVAAPGCDPGDIAEQCGLTCEGSVLDGNASISGVASVDAFFGAVIDVTTAANDISATLRAELDAIAISVGLDAGATGPEIAAGIEAHLGLYIDLDAAIRVQYQEPVCEASLEVVASASAECDVEVDPGMASIECNGSCEVEGGANATCEGEASLKCTGPKLQCDGMCEGSCEFEAGGTCEGTCRGECAGDCSVEDSSGNCAGACDGTCTGTCEFAAAAECTGSCTGSCTYDSDAGCEAGASAKCEASVDASVTCEGSCEGDFEPPEVSAECQASVEAKAEASLECTPPSIDITWQWAAGITAEQEMEFKAWLQGFKGHLSVMLAARTKADILIESMANLASTGVAAIEGGADAIAGGNFAASFKITTCAIPELANVGTVIDGASGSLTGSVSASIDVFGAVNI